MARKRKPRRQTPTSDWSLAVWIAHGGGTQSRTRWLVENDAALTAYYRAGRSPADAARRLARAKARKT